MRKSTILLFGLLTLPLQAVAQPTGSAPIISVEARSSHILRDNPGFLIDVYATPLTADTAGYLLLFNAVSAPSNGAVKPQSCIHIPANATGGYLAGNHQLEWFTVGITAEFSTTGCFTATASNAFFHGRVK